MKNKIKLLIIILSIIIVGAIIFIIINSVNGKSNPLKELSEYTPQQEISDEQMRETIVTLYYLNKDTEELKSEGRLISATKLLENPYKTIVELLILGPNNTNLSNVFPNNTKILDAKIENNCVILNFSEEITNYKDDVQKYNIINSILNSVTQLVEVDSIKILVNNKIVKDFDEEYTAIY